MPKTSPSVELSPTSAVVQLWLRGHVHTSKEAQRYLNALDLRAGRAVYKVACQPWKHYDQVIVNRKDAVLENACEVLDTRPRGSQVVLMASGWDALGVELAARYPKARIFEIDSENMDAKSKLIRSLLPALSKRIRATECDITKPALVKKKLVAAGWKASEPTLVVFEGISYYISEKNLAALVALFSTGEHANSLIVEYLVPFANVSQERRHIPQGSFGMLRRSFGLRGITHYTSAKLRQLLPKAGLIQKETLHEIELRRTGRNPFFPRQADGWIEVCQFNL